MSARHADRVQEEAEIAAAILGAEPRVGRAEALRRAAALADPGRVWRPPRS